MSKNLNKINSYETLKGHPIYSELSNHNYSLDNIKDIFSTFKKNIVKILDFLKDFFSSIEGLNSIDILHADQQS